MDLPTHSDSIIVARSPDDLYAMVADVTRMGEYSPICKECWWDEGDGPRVGARTSPGATCSPNARGRTRSEVVAAEPGREFAWVVGADVARWGYTFSSVDGGTQVTESWEFRPGGVVLFEERFGDDAPVHIADRHDGPRRDPPRRSPRSSAPRKVEGPRSVADLNPTSLPPPTESERR